MISELARVFSSQGVLIQGTTYASRTQKQKLKSDDNSRDNTTAVGKNSPESFASQFDQASSKLELSKAAQKKLSANGKPLSEEEQKVVEELAKRDKEVHAHENAHLTNAGGAAQGGAKMAAEAQKELAAKPGSDQVNPYLRSNPQSGSKASGQLMSVYA